MGEVSNPSKKVEELNMSIKSDFFKTEINNIQDLDLQAFVREYLEHYVPEYFFTIGASASGKFHPAFSQGNGGLVRHTKAVCLFVEELLRMSSYMYLPDYDKDIIRVACICHDTCKYGLENEIIKEEYTNHAWNAAVCVDRAWNDCYNEKAPYILTHAIETHMGQWTTDKSIKAYTPHDRCVHMADYMASRSFIDIPQITADWDAVIASYENKKEGEAE